ncbi:MAG: hypothetical protein JNL70_01535 [Saprospiraceae bacterium]|nr:hypothetical protein [Saprospiraceae bacterium]
MKYPQLLLASFLILLSANLFAQRFGYPSVHERQLIGTKWRYAYTLHIESNTTVHQADKDYQYFLFFKYDFTFEQSLHGKLSKGNWSLSGGTLFYPFRNIKKFEIAAINNKALVLEFQQPNSSGTYQYHFVAVDSKDAPFVRPANELPEVIVEAEPKQPKRRSWWAILKGGDDEQKKAETKRKEQTYISVELIGGGYYGGIDPVIKDFTRITTDGRLIHEFQTVNNPLRVVKKNISRKELEDFAQYIMDNKFFQMQRMYDCNSPACEKRKVMKPTPIPLRLTVTYGDKKRMVTIAIWGDDNYKMKYVDYPPALDNIIEAIQRMTHRIDDKLTRS